MLRTLADVPALIEWHLPQHFGAMAAWPYIAARLEAAAHGGDTMDVAVPLRLVLSMEGVECHPE